MQEEFKKNGFIYLKNVLSAAEITQLQVDSKDAAATKSGDDVLDKGGLQFHALLINRRKKFVRLYHKLKLSIYCRRLKAPIFGCDGIRRQRKAGCGHVSLALRYSIQCFKRSTLSILVSMTSMTADNDGLWMMPGSHKVLLKFEKEDGHVVYKGNTDNIVFISAKPRDEVIFSSFIAFYIPQ